MANSYHYLLAGLPEISLEHGKLSYSLYEFKEELMETLQADDYLVIENLFFSIDNKNVLNRLLQNDAAFIDGGKYTQEELDEAIATSELLPEYLEQFVIAYQENTPIVQGQSWENQLTGLFYQHLTSLKNEFLADWFSFELELKNILTALNCRKAGISIENQIIGHNEVAEALKTNTSKDFGLSADVEYIDKLIQTFETKTLSEKEKEIDLLKWNYLEEKATFEYFSLERVITYTIQFGIIERWLKLDPQAGRELFERMLNNLENSYEFPTEFALK